jgi:hypothetical protein
MRLVTFLLLMLMSMVCLAQSPKKKGKTDNRNAPTSLEPFYPEEQYIPKASKKRSSKGPTYESEQEYHERMAQLVKTKRKNEKLMMQPQYSDPSYFGHKRPPKRHKAGKLKFCKECGIRH